MTRRIFILGRETGSSLLGYGMVTGLIAVVALAAVSAAGGSISNLFGETAERMDAAAPSGGGDTGTDEESSEPVGGLEADASSVSGMDVTGPGSPDVATGSTVDVTITNAGTETTGTITAEISAGGENFEIITTDCAALDPGLSCTVTLRPRSVANGPYSGTLSVSAAPGGDVEVALSGTAAGFADACPEMMNGIPSGVFVECTCTLAQIESGGPVWGDEPYRADSNACRAAVHNGDIPTTGGKARIRWANGVTCSNWSGIERNGITSVASTMTFSKAFFSSTSCGGA
jgi:Flp pilus assembly pilin Flp